MDHVLATAYKVLEEVPAVKPPLRVDPSAGGTFMRIRFQADADLNQIIILPERTLSDTEKAFAVRATGKRSSGHPEIR